MKYSNILRTTILKPLKCRIYFMFTSLNNRWKQTRYSIFSDASVSTSVWSLFGSDEDYFGTFYTKKKKTAAVWPTAPRMRRPPAPRLWRARLWSLPFTSRRRQISGAFAARPPVLSTERASAPTCDRTCPKTKVGAGGRRLRGGSVRAGKTHDAETWHGEANAS